MNTLRPIVTMIASNPFLEDGVDDTVRFNKFSPVTRNNVTAEVRAIVEVIPDRRISVYLYAQITLRGISNQVELSESIDFIVEHKSENENYSISGDGDDLTLSTIFAKNFSDKYLPEDWGVLEAIIRMIREYLRVDLRIMMNEIMPFFQLFSSEEAEG